MSFFSCPGWIFYFFPDNRLLILSRFRFFLSRGVFFCPNTRFRDLGVLGVLGVQVFRCQTRWIAQNRTHNVLVVLCRCFTQSSSPILAVLFMPFNNLKLRVLGPMLAVIAFTSSPALSVSSAVPPASGTSGEAMRLRILFLTTQPRLALPSFCRKGGPPSSATRPVDSAPASKEQIVVLSSMFLSKTVLMTKSTTTLRTGTPYGVKRLWVPRITIAPKHHHQNNVPPVLALHAREVRTNPQQSGKYFRAYLRDSDLRSEAAMQSIPNQLAHFL